MLLFCSGFAPECAGSGKRDASAEAQPRWPPLIAHAKAVLRAKP
jgi:hypothetical protein